MQTCANTGDELWPKLMGRKSEKAGILQFDGVLYGISLFLVLRLNLLNFHLLKKYKTPNASEIILAETEYFISSRKKEKEFDFLRC